jgi:hypothetical protein
VRGTGSSAAATVREWVLRLTLRIYECPQEDADDRISRLGVFLDSSPMEEENPEFLINAVFELAAENKDPSFNETRPLFHTFCRESADWGFRELVCTAVPSTGSFSILHLPFVNYWLSS